MKNQIETIKYVKLFTLKFIEDFKNLKPTKLNTKGAYSELCDVIDETQTLRNDYINFLSSVVSNEYNYGIEHIVLLLENLLDTINDYKNNAYKYEVFVTELFIYTVVILLENRNYNDLIYLLKSNYWIQVEPNSYKSLTVLDLNFITIKKLPNPNSNENMKNLLSFFLKKERHDQKYYNSLLEAIYLLQNYYKENTENTFNKLTEQESPTFKLNLLKSVLRSGVEEFKDLKTKIEEKFIKNS